MADNRGKWAVGASAAVIAVGGGVAHLGGAFRGTADDASRFTDDIGRTIDDLPSPGPGSPRIPASGAQAELETAAREGDESKDVVCAAVSFHETAADPETTFEGFARWAADEINQVPRARAERVYAAARRLYEEGDLSAISDIGCER